MNNLDDIFTLIQITERALRNTKFNGGSKKCMGKSELDELAAAYDAGKFREARNLIKRLQVEHGI